MYSRQLSEGLADLARANDQKRDAALLRATTELFVLDVAHDRDELRRFEELATHFLPKVSEADRIFVAERIAACPDTPASVARMLARDVIAVAAPVIRQSRSLSTVDLLTIIATTGPEHHRAIAERAALPAEVIQALMLKGSILVPERAPVAAEPSSRTPGVDAARHDPWQFLALDRPGRLRVISDIAANPPAPTSSPDQRLDHAFRAILSAAQIVSYARSAQLGAIIGSAADGLRLPSDLVAAALNDHGGELLAIILKALRLDEAQAGQVFLLASPSGRDVNVFFPLADLYAGMEHFVADALLDSWRTGTQRHAVGHEPHLAPDGDHARRPAARERAVERAPRENIARRA